MKYPTTALLVATAPLAIAPGAAGGDCSPYPNAVEWRVQDGGNGHYYARIRESVSWETASQRAGALGAHLATIGSAAENDFIASFAEIGTTVPCHIGGIKVNGSWTWITGEPWSFTNWYIGEPNNQGGQENWLLFYSSNGFWNDMEPNYQADYIVEWSVSAIDCNGNDICDLDEIAKSPGLDLNDDGVIDGCQCIADVVVDGEVNGVDLARILNDWGTA
ncbi:MAG: C-type lectin domain-containing protein, partial [Planctomycetota bacterium]